MPLSGGGRFAVVLFTDLRLTRRNDRQIENGRMNPKDQAWQPLDPAAGSLPQEIESALVDADSLPACIVILVDSELDRDWCAQASLAVTKQWAASGHRVILADGCLDRPILHEAVGVENGEGVSDMVLYGASPRRISGRVEDRLMLAPAGTPVVEVAEVLAHVKWNMVIGGCREVGATLVVHVSTGTPGVEAMTERAEGVVVLAPASKDVETILGSASGPLIGVLGPMNGDAAVVVIEDEESDVASVEGLGGLTDVEEQEVVEDEEAALPVEAAAALPEEEASPPFTVDDLPELPSSAGEDGETPDSFSVTDLAGAQYGAGDSSEVAVKTADLDSEADQDVASPTDVDEMEAAGGEEDAEGLKGRAVEDDIESQKGAGVQDDASGEAVATGGDASPDMEDFEAGAGLVAEDTPERFEDAVDGLVDVPDGLLDAADDVGKPSDLEPATAVASDGIDFGAVNFGEAVPDGVSGSLSELVVEESPTEVDPSPPERRLRYKGLARLERRRKRDVFVRQVLTGLFTLLIVGGGGFAAAYYGYMNIPGITPAERVRSYVPPPVILPGPTPRSPVMSHALLVDSWFTVETPLSTADALRTRLPNLLFFVTPVEVDGARQFALLVGPAYSAVEANALKDPLAVVMDRLDPNDWTVRDTPYAFYFGEYDTAVNAQGRIQALAAASIPAYALQVDYPDGATGVRVYGGAFSDQFEAVEMGRMVSDADIGGMVLAFRRGNLPE